MKLLFLSILMMVMAVQMIAHESWAGDKKDIEKEVMRLLDDYMNAFNRQDLVAWENTFHFPHYRLASGRMHVSNAPGEITAAAMERYLDSIGWHHSTWDRRDIIHFSDNKVHVDTKFTRYRKDGSIIGSYESLYILTRMEGKWGVIVRSSFAE